MTKKKTDAEAAIDIAAETLSGDVTTFLLDELKHFTKPYVAMDEETQSDAIHRCRDQAEKIVKKAVQIIAAQGRKAMAGKLQQITVKDGIKAVVTLSREDEQRHDLMDAQGQAVMIVIADAEPYTGEREPIVADPTQKDMLSEAEKLAAGDDKVSPFKPV